MPFSTPRTVLVDTSRSAHTRLKPVPISDVTLTDDFWAPRRRVNREVTLPSQFRHCDETKRLDNFRRAAGEIEGDFVGIFFNDSDVYKWLEAAAWTLATDDDAALAAMVHTAAGVIEAAQQPDGYLDTYFMFDKAKDRWSNLRDMHELYCAGHFIQAAVAHYRATGSERMLNVARRLADCICATFGDGEGQRRETDGHEEIEMALVELARATGEARYQQQAQFFIDVRGHGTIGGSSYHQDHKPFRELGRMIGHAVRAVYLTCGATDLLAETGEGALRQALDRQWDNMTTKQMYVSGGLGSRYEGEAFGKDYELPNERAYTETCAAIGSVMWNHRMLMLEGDARYADILETTLYNAVLPGLSLDGQSYFYQNPLSDDGTHRREPWFGCACCPPNVARLLASLPAYFYSVSDQGVWCHLYAQGSASLTRPGGATVALNTTTCYPWDGDISITLSEIVGDPNFTLFLRIPAWCETGAPLLVNGEPASTPLTPGSYAAVTRAWQAGDTVHLALPMPVRRLRSHPYAQENAGKVALMRGPILYCVEQVDNPDVDPRDVVLAATAATDVVREDLLNGVVALQMEATVQPVDADWQRQLYRSEPVAKPQSRRPVTITAVPYYAWANRAAGRMQVWLQSE